MPPQLKKKPKYEFQYAFYREGFRRLNASRSYGISRANPIAYEAMTSRLNEYKLDVDAREMAIRIWQRMDAHLLEVSAKKRDK